jgi:hypothetical protein
MLSHQNTKTFFAAKKTSNPLTTNTDSTVSAVELSRYYVHCYASRWMKYDYKGADIFSLRRFLALN